MPVAAQPHSFPDEPTQGFESDFTYRESVIYKPYITADEVKQLDTGQLPLAKNKHSSDICSCVLYLQDKTHDPRIKGWGIAKLIPTTSKTPYPHGFAVTLESTNGHLLEYRLINGFVVSVDEANYLPCQASSGRIVNPAVIKGFLPL